MSYEEENDII